jgi:acyl-CoA thioester hydrolase
MLNDFAAHYRIYYEDTDSGGVVYYANYLKFFERARTDFLRSRGISQDKLSNEDGILFVVKRCEIDYIIPARLDDLILVSVKLTKLGAASIIMEQSIFKNNDEKNLLTKMKVEIVCIDAKSFKPKKISKEIKNKIEKIC